MPRGRGTGSRYWGRATPGASGGACELLPSLRETSTLTRERYASNDRATTTPGGSIPRLPGTPRLRGRKGATRPRAILRPGRLVDVRLLPARAMRTDPPPRADGPTRAPGVRLSRIRLLCSERDSHGTLERLC